LEQSKLAEENRQGLLQAKYNISANFLVLARLLKDNRDNALWKILGYDSFEALLGSPEIGFRRSKAYNLIKLYELYIQKLCVPERDIVEIGNAKLTLISPVVESDVDSWLSKAKSLSKSDLLISIAEAAGKTLPRLSPPTPPSQPSFPLPRMTPEVYLKIVQHSPCINCGQANTIVKAHFPRTRVRCEKPWHVIPLCPACHAEQEGSMEWCWKYRGNWAKWFYNLIAGE